jgi:hypothetical protein
VRLGGCLAQVNDHVRDDISKGWRDLSPRF